MDMQEARVNITYGGQNADLPDTVSVDAPDDQILSWVKEAIEGGSVPGLEAVGAADLTDFVVDRFSATEVRPFHLIQLRPKTPFGR